MSALQTDALERAVALALAVTLSGQARFICSACGQSAHGHDIHYCPAAGSPLACDSQTFVDVLKAERDRAREECGYEKRMRQFVSGERDYFIRTSMVLEWLLAEARWHIQHSAAGVTFDGRTWYPTPNTISASSDE